LNSNEHKIVFTGTMGAGKTTAIGAISEIAPIVTDVKNTDETLAKARTTVGFDYGELTLDTGDKLRLYGTPGQARFSFMWRITAQGALGIVVLIDNTRPDPIDDLNTYLDGFSDALDSGIALVVGVGRSELCARPGIDDFVDALAARGIVAPVLPVDVRQRNHVIVLIDVLLSQLEQFA
jgi:uncharacterized protein